MPVLPLVASMTVCPGLSEPSRSAASITPSASRSLTEPSGLDASSFANSSTPAGAMLLMRTTGVLPTVSSIDFLIPAIPCCLRYLRHRKRQGNVVHPAKSIVGPARFDPSAFITASAISKTRPSRKRPATSGGDAAAVQRDRPIAARTAARLSRPLWLYQTRRLRLIAASELAAAGCLNRVAALIPQHGTPLTFRLEVRFCPDDIGHSPPRAYMLRSRPLEDPRRCTARVAETLRSTGMVAAIARGSAALNGWPKRASAIHRAPI